MMLTEEYDNLRGQVPHYLPINQHIPLIWFSTLLHFPQWMSASRELKYEIKNSSVEASVTHSLTSWIKLWRLLLWERESSSPSAPALIAAHLADELIRLQTRGLIQSTVHAQLLLIRLLVYKQLILFFKKLIFWFICPQRAAPDVNLTRAFILQNIPRCSAIFHRVCL